MISQMFLVYIALRVGAFLIVQYTALLRSSGYIRVSLEKKLWKKSKKKNWLTVASGIAII